jgi:hypothetical protein
MALVKRTYNQSLATAVYRPADIVGLIGADSRAVKDSATRHGAQFLGEEGDLGERLRAAAGAIKDLGRGALRDFLQRRSDALSFTLADDYFETSGLTKRRKIYYREVATILARPHDRYKVYFNGGSFSIRPVAHLVAGRVKVPIGWKRNEMEVTFETLPLELAARCGIEIEEE